MTEKRKFDKEAIYLEFSGKVSQYVKSRIRNREDAEDIVSSVFVKIYAKLDTYNPQKASLSTWIYAITRNTVIDFFAAQDKMPLHFEDEIGYLEEKEMDSMDELLERLSEELERLPEKQRDIVVLHYYYQLSHKEIAEKMGLSYMNTRKLCSMAVVKMRKELEK